VISPATLVGCAESFVTLSSFVTTRAVAGALIGAVERRNARVRSTAAQARRISRINQDPEDSPTGSESSAALYLAIQTSSLSIMVSGPSVITQI